MRKIFLVVSALILIQIRVRAQFTSGNHLFVEKGTTITLDGLVLTPSSEDLLIANKIITTSLDAISGPANNSIKRVYAFNEPFNFTGSARINYKLAELNGNIGSNLQMAYLTPGNSYIVTAGSTNNVNQNWVSQSFISKSFSKITAINGGSALPVTLISFSGRKVEEKVILSWKTSTEMDSDYFHIEQSIDGKNWRLLGNVNASHNSRSLMTYEYIDENPSNASNLYRLKMVDLDQSFSYSGVVNVFFADGSRINVYPNPAADQLLIRNEDWSNVKNIVIFDTSGNLVRIKKQGSTADPMVKELDLQGVPPGNYLLKIFMKDLRTKSFTFFKQ
jgi:hypothetical protein